MSVTPAIAQVVQAYAEKHATSLNAIIRKCFDFIAAELVTTASLENMICVNALVLQDIDFRRARKLDNEINAMLKKMAASAFVPDTNGFVVQAVTLN